MKPIESCVIFGGTGFIGTHIAQHLIRENLANRIVLVDILPPRQEGYTATLQEGLRSGRVEFVHLDVRQPIPHGALPEQTDLIFNLAAVHREPGHQPHEYFETNLAGAENVCAYAVAARCNRIVFTSSISPYGPSEGKKDEKSLTVPETAYGSSKLAAEKMHLGWQAGGEERSLLILRPGVVFGPGEGGNVTRLVRSLVKGYFVYVGNEQTRKAGGYVKELAWVAQFGLERQETTGEAVTLLNFGVNPTPTLESFVDAIRIVAGIRRKPLSIPRQALIGASYPVDFVARIFGIKQPVSPVRVRKLYRSTWIEPTGLATLGYQWKYDLVSSFEDWKRDNPSDFAA